MSISQKPGGVPKAITVLDGEGCIRKGPDTEQNVKVSARLIVSASNRKLWGERTEQKTYRHSINFLLFSPHKCILIDLARAGAPLCIPPEPPSTRVRGQDITSPAAL